MPRTFIDHLNHEIRSPLTVVVGMTELFSLSTLTKEQRHWLRTMQQAVNCVLRLMDGAVDFSRLSANQLALRAEPFSLNGVLNDVGLALAQNRSPADLETSVQDGVPGPLIGDAARVRQALLGLTEHLILVRGIQRAGIRVALRARSTEGVALEFAVGEANHVLSTSESPDDRDGEFIACSEATVDRRRGLELAVAAGLAGAMQGGVWIANDKDAAVAGRLVAAFALPGSIPSLSRDFAQKLGFEPPARADAVEPKRILLAEDTRAIRRLLVSLLKRHGHTVKAAKDGLEAVQILAREEAAARPFDVVILDLEMPVMDGRQAAAEIRKRVASRPIRIVALTAHRTEGNPELLGSGEFDAAVGKPVDAEQLLAVVASCRASLSPPRGAASREMAAGTNGDDSVDYAGALRRLCGNEQLLDDLVRFFLEDSPELLSAARAAIDRRDAKALERTAHGIRGLASNFGAPSTVGAAAALEQLGHDAAFDEAESALEELEAEVRQLTAILQRRSAGSASRGGSC
ncbi:MAG TPA: response regulator [Pirellulales bacterium]|nr:response regulator [Pirellulales bacterium]